MKLLESRSLPEGGFPARGGERFRSDATAWAILALSRLVSGHPLLGPARDRLTTAQDPDGRVSMSREHGRPIGRLLSVFSPGMGLRCTSLTVTGEFSFFSKLQDNIGARIPMTQSGMTLVSQDGLGLTARTPGSSPLR